MKHLRLFLCALGSIIFFTSYGQIAPGEDSYNELSDLFGSIDWIGISVNGEKDSDTENIKWMRLTEVYIEECEIKMKYFTDFNQGISANCVVPVLNIESDDLKQIDISGLSSLRLELSGKYIFMMDDNNNRIGKTNILYFRICYDDSTFKALIATLKKIRNNCMK